MGGSMDPGPQSVSPFSDTLEGIVRAVFMPGWHCVDVVQLLTCWAAWLQFTFLPLLPPFLHSSLSLLHLALRPRLYHQKWGSPILCSSKAARPSGLIKNRHIWFWQTILAKGRSDTFSLDRANWHVLFRAFSAWGGWENLDFIKPKYKTCAILKKSLK